MLPTRLMHCEAECTTPVQLNPDWAAFNTSMALLQPSYLHLPYANLFLQSCYLLRRPLPQPKMRPEARTGSGLKDKTAFIALGTTQRRRQSHGAITAGSVRAYLHQAGNKRALLGFQARISDHLKQATFSSDQFLPTLLQRP